MDIKDRVLVVEDDKSIRNFFRTVLEANNYDVIMADTGTEAYSLITSRCPDVVLLDLGLPDMDGMKILKSVREYKKSSILCPIFMIGEAAMEILIPWLTTFIIEELKNLSINPAYAVKTNIIIICSVSMAACALFALFCGMMGSKCAAKASCGFARNLREDMYSNLQ